MSKSNKLWLKHRIDLQNIRDMTPLKTASDNENMSLLAWLLNHIWVIFGNNTSQSKLCKDWIELKTKLKALLKVKKNSKPCWETKLI